MPYILLLIKRSIIIYYQNQVLYDEKENAVNLDMTLMFNTNKNIHYLVLLVKLVFIFLCRISPRTLLTYCTTGVLLRTLMSGDNSLSFVTHIIVVSSYLINYKFHLLNNLSLS